MFMYALEQVFLEHKSAFIYTKIIETGFPWYLLNIVQLCINKVQSQRTEPSPGAEAALQLPAWHQLWQRARVSAPLLRRNLWCPHT